MCCGINLGLCGWVGLCNLSKHLATGPGRKLTSRVPLAWQPCPVYKYILNAEQPTSIPAPTSLRALPAEERQPEALEPGGGSPSR